MSNADWYARKLGQPQPPVSTPPSTPVSQEPALPSPNKAMSARMSERCPGCNSGNYFAPMGTQKMRCYDCGYPLVQQGTGVSGTSSDGSPAKPARGQSTGSFQPTVIVDRIG